MLKTTGVRLENIVDIEKGLRGGISYIAKRYAKANNKYIKNYNPKKFVTFLDMNKLYGLAMKVYLPQGGFKCLKNVDGFDVSSISKKSPTGYILEADLEYSDDLHALHNVYQLVPEKLAISYDMQSDYCKKSADKYEIKFGDVKKSIPNLGNKTNYVLHYRNLQLCLSLGVRLTKIHRVLKFKQSDWTKKYIDFNTEKKLLIVLKKIFLN